MIIYKCAPIPELISTPMRIYLINFITIINIVIFQVLTSNLIIQSLLNCLNFIPNTILFINHTCTLSGLYYFDFLFQFNLFFN